MEVIYSKNGHRLSSNKWNKDIDVYILQVGERTTVKVRANTKVSLLLAKEDLPFHVNFQDTYFLNGYQSWTDTKEFHLRERLRNIKKSPHIISKMFAMEMYGDSTFYKYSIRKSHGYDIFYSRGKHECFLFNLNYRRTYLLIELIKDNRNLHLSSDLRGVTLEAGQEYTVFDYCFYKSNKEGFEGFHEYFPKVNTEKLFGYSSWYNYYQNINEEIILRDLDALDKRFNVFQIDDGYETYVGDWLDVDEKKFPHGLKPIVDKIHEKGYKAGIWLAPFVAETKSKLFKEHPEYFKKENKKPLKAGGNWSGFYALDLDKEEVRKYIRKCLVHYMNMGFDFFKLDFLYAAGLGDHKDKTRAEAQFDAYEFLREVLKDKIILGCGANIMSSYTNFDYLRIGPDVSLIFDDVRYMRMFHRERISTKVTIQNTVYRFFLNNYLFGNDPDVFLLRDENIQFSFEQRRALTTMNAIFGSLLMTSDNIATYHEKQNEVLDHALELFRNARIKNFERKRDKIHVEYYLKGEVHSFDYHTKKGVLLNER